jgi:hypothetical protein
MMVPAATALAAVALQLLPAAPPVEQVAITVPAVQVADVVDGVTWNRSQVVVAPVYETMVMLGLQAAGTLTVTSAFRVVCCTPPPGRFQATAPVFPPIARGMPVGLAPVP